MCFRRSRGGGSMTIPHRQESSVIFWESSGTCPVRFLTYVVFGVPSHLHIKEMEKNVIFVFPLNNHRWLRLNWSRVKWSTGCLVHGVNCPWFSCHCFSFHYFSCSVVQVPSGLSTGCMTQGLSSSLPTGVIITNSLFTCVISVCCPISLLWSITATHTILIYFIWSVLITCCRIISIVRIVHNLQRKLKRFTCGDYLLIGITSDSFLKFLHTDMTQGSILSTADWLIVICKVGCFNSTTA